MQRIVYALGRFDVIDLGGLGDAVLCPAMPTDRLIGQLLLPQRAPRSPISPTRRRLPAVTERSGGGSARRMARTVSISASRHGRSVVSGETGGQTGQAVVGQTVGSANSCDALAFSSSCQTSVARLR